MLAPPPPPRLLYGPRRLDTHRRPPAGSRTLHVPPKGRRVPEILGRRDGPRVRRLEGATVPESLPLYPRLAPPPPGIPPPGSAPHGNQGVGPGAAHRRRG